VRGPARRPHFSLAIISVTVQLWTEVFWVISLYFNIRNTLPKSGTFLLGHPVYMVVFLFNTVIYVVLLLRLCILIVCLCIFIVPAGTLRLPWLRVFRAFSSVVRQMPGYNSQRRSTARTLSKIFVSSYLLFVCKCVLYCTVLYCTVPYCTVLYCTTATGW
jgi:hypothetical protein